MDPLEIMKNDRSQRYDYQSKERHIPSIRVLRNYDNSGKDHIYSSREKCETSKFTAASNSMD